MAKDVAIPSTRIVKDLQHAVTSKGGAINRSIHSGAMIGVMPGNEAKELIQQLTDVLDYCQKSQEVIFELQAKLALQTQQTLSFNA